MICHRCGGIVSDTELEGDIRLKRNQVHKYTDDCLIHLKDRIEELKEMIVDGKERK